jgi:hypothetical protein
MRLRAGMLAGSGEYRLRFLILFIGVMSCLYSVWDIVDVGPFTRLMKAILTSGHPVKKGQLVGRKRVCHHDRLLRFQILG